MVREYEPIYDVNYRIVGWMIIPMELDISDGNPSEAIEVEGLRFHTWEVFTNASTSNVTVVMQISQDGSNWTDVASWTGTGNSGIQPQVDRKIRYVRFNPTSMGDATSVKVKYSAQT